MPILKVPEQPQADTPSRGDVSQSSPIRAVPVLDWERAARITRQRAGIDQPDVDLPDPLDSTITALSPANATNAGPVTRKAPFRKGPKATKGNPRNRFHHERLPMPKLYYEKEGLKLIGRGEWRSALCTFHDDRHPSLRIHIASGAFKCMVCGEKGGDVLAFQMMRHNRSFVAAAKDLGAWEEACR